MAGYISGTAFSDPNVVTMISLSFCFIVSVEILTDSDLTHALACFSQIDESIDPRLVRHVDDLHTRISQKSEQAHCSSGSPVGVHDNHTHDNHPAGLLPEGIYCLRCLRSKVVIVTVETPLIVG